MIAQVGVLCTFLYIWFWFCLLLIADEHFAEVLIE